MEWQQFDNTTGEGGIGGVTYMYKLTANEYIKNILKNVHPATCVLNLLSHSDKNTEFR